MLEGAREALEYIVGLGNRAEKTEVLEIDGKTYADRSLVRYDERPKADPIRASSLTALVDYIACCSGEFQGDMLIHIVSPTKVRLMSALDAERERETLFETDAEVSEFKFDQWYDQERFMIELQANFQETDDLKAVMKMAGNIDKKNGQSFSDDGVTQVATITVGVAAKADAMVPNPVELVPFRTFQEVEQPSSRFVFRIGDKEVPAFKIVEAQGGIWKNIAVAGIKRYLVDALTDMPDAISDRITIIG